MEILLALLMPSTFILQFDEVLSEKWDTALANGSFWYTLDDVKRRHLDGKIGFIAQVCHFLSVFVQRRIFYNNDVFDYSSLNDAKILCNFFKQLSTFSLLCLAKCALMSKFTIV